jgi:hypothetical protein
VSRLPLCVEDPPQRLLTEDWFSCTTTCHEVIAAVLVFAMVTLAQYPDPQSEDKARVAFAFPPVTSLCSAPDLSGSETSCAQATNTRETRKADRAISDRGRRSVRMRRARARLVPASETRDRAPLAAAWGEGPSRHPGGPGRHRP